MKLNLTVGERVAVITLIGDKQQVNRSDARMVMSIEDSLHTNDASLGQVTFEEAEKEAEFELDAIEIRWILDGIEKLFGEGRMPRQVARFALSIEEKLKDALQTKS